MFVFLIEGVFDISYFMSCYIWNFEEDNVFGVSDFDGMFVSCSDFCSSGLFSNIVDEDVSKIFGIIIYVFFCQV